MMNTLYHFFPLPFYIVLVVVTYFKFVDFKTSNGRLFREGVFTLFAEPEDLEGWECLNSIVLESDHAVEELARNQDHIDG
jgi:hypothetical protein